MIRSHFVANPGRLTRFAAQAGRATAQAWHRFWDWQARRATVTILHGLDDRTLRDIGVSRAEISSLIYGKGGGQRRVYDADWRCHLRGCP